MDMPDEREARKNQARSRRVRKGFHRKPIDVRLQHERAIAEKPLSDDWLNMQLETLGPLTFTQKGKQ